MVVLDKVWLDVESKIYDIYERDYVDYGVIGRVLRDILLVVIGWCCYR